MEKPQSPLLNLRSIIFNLTPFGWPPSIKIKGKSVPLQAWSGPEGSGNLRFPDF